VFILRQKLFLTVIALASLGWSALLVDLARRNGHGAPADLMTMAAIGLMCGAGTAVLCVLPGFFVYRALFTAPPTAALEAGERILSTSRANHFLNGEGRGGRLFVTERRIGFLPHRYNVQLAPWSVAWDSVTGFSTPNSAVVGAVAAVAGVPARALQNFLVVQLRDGKQERLVVWNRKQMAEYLDRLRVLGAEERAAAAEQARLELGLPSLGQSLHS
jgi:hypothetical protein